MSAKSFEVTIRFQYPAWDEKDGISYTLTADSKAQAAKYARHEAERDGHLPATGKGRVSVVAVETEAEAEWDDWN